MTHLEILNSLLLFFVFICFFLLFCFRFFSFFFFVMYNNKKKTSVSAKVDCPSVFLSIFSFFFCSILSSFYFRHLLLVLYFSRLFYFLFSSSISTHWVLKMDFQFQILEFLFSLRSLRCGFYSRSRGG